MSKHSIASIIFHNCRALETPQLNYSALPIPDEITWKPGGTLTLSSGPLTAHLIDKGSDEVGCWSYQTFSGKYGIKVTFITCYQIPKKGNSVGKFTNEAQQEAHLQKIGCDASDVRKLFYKDLYLSF